jgi:hypothetical protein
MQNDKKNSPGENSLSGSARAASRRAGARARGLRIAVIVSVLGMGWLLALLAAIAGSIAVKIRRRRPEHRDPDASPPAKTRSRAALARLHLRAVTGARRALLITVAGAAGIMSMIALVGVFIATQHESRVRELGMISPDAVPAAAALPSPVPPQDPPRSHQQGSDVEMRQGSDDPHSAPADKVDEKPGVGAPPPAGDRTKQPQDSSSQQAEDQPKEPPKEQSGDQSKEQKKDDSGDQPKAQPKDHLDGWITESIEILKDNGYPTDKMSPSDIRAIIHHESAGDPRAINNWDSNAAKGTPSKGLMQTIDPTFQTWSLPGHRDIWNPVDNIVAAVRYSVGTYGSISNVPGVAGLKSGAGYRGY